MADIFVSYTSADKQWAEWIGFEIDALGHKAHLHDWEISGGGNLVAWMEKTHHEADHILFVVTQAYLGKPYSTWERHAAEWAAVTKRPNFALPVFIEDCEPPTLLAPFKRCELFGVDKVEVKRRLAAFLTPACKPPTQPAFPGSAATVTATSTALPPPFPAAAPTRAAAISNIPYRTPEHFVGREDSMEAMEAALAGAEGRVAITALHGLRGVGKTILAAAYANTHGASYRATWWIAAETDSTLRAGLVGLGVKLGWVAPDAPEDAAVAAVLDRLRHQGDGVLLIYDNAIDPDSLKPYLPRGGAAKIVVTSNAPNWRGIATPVEIEVWPPDVGAQFLVERTGRTEERASAEKLSETLHGLPLAHEQAAAYCEDLDVGFDIYRERFETAPATLLGDADYTPAEHNNRQTVAKSFALGIEQAGQRHAAAEALITHAALLAPEPIPLFFFLEGAEKLGPPFDGLDASEFDKAIAALRRFALVEVEEIEDERDPAIVTRCLRLHRLVRVVAAAQVDAERREDARRRLIVAMQAVYPEGVYDDPKCWPRARQLDAAALALVEDVAPPDGAEAAASWLLNLLAAYRQVALGAYRAAVTLFERALALNEERLSPNDEGVATILSNLGDALRELGGVENLDQARKHLTRAAEIGEKALGSEHFLVGVRLSVLGLVLKALGGADNLKQAREHLTRALEIDERAFAPDHPNIAIRLSNLATVLQDLGGTDNLEEARRHLTRALDIDEKALGADHPSVAIFLSNLATVLRDIGGAENLDQAREHLTRALDIDENTLGPHHLNVAIRLSNLAGVLKDIGGAGNIARARKNFVRAEKIMRAALGDQHPRTQIVAQSLARFRAEYGD